MPTKSGFTAAQHVDLGQRLARMQDDLNAAISEVGQAYQANGREVKALERTARALEAARSVMDDAAGPVMSTHEASEAYYPDDAGTSGAMNWSA